MISFEIQILEPTRTICEKIMSLVRFSYTENPIVDLGNKIRHCYDLHQLLRQNQFTEFFESDDFAEMLLEVANDDVISFKSNNRWLIHHPNEAIIFKDIENIWQDLRTTYNGNFRKLVYGKLPSDADVAVTIQKIKERLAYIKWTIEVPEQN